MAFANSDISDIIATTIESRSGVVADNVTENNALLMRLRQRGRVKPISGGQFIMQELSFAENSNAMYYSGGEALAIAAQDVISAARFDIKQAACAVTITGLEQLQNSGEEQFIDLLDARIDVAESSLMNLIASGIYSDGTLPPIPPSSTTSAFMNLTVTKPMFAICASPVNRWLFCSDAM